MLGVEPEHKGFGAASAVGGAAMCGDRCRRAHRSDHANPVNLLPQVEAKLGLNDPEVTRARSLMTFLESEA
jgi:hypothetical protein